MPEGIPVIYTGLNAARPDWKSFNRDVSTRISQLEAKNQQQAQFDQLQNERRRKEFLEYTDVDALNTTNENLLNKKYEITKGVEDYATQALTESGGEVSDKQLMEMRMLTNRANQEISKFNNWSKNWEIDRKAAEANLDIYDEKKVRENIMNWDGNTPYNKSRLDSAYKDITVDEVRNRWFQKMVDPDEFSTTAMLQGKSVDGQGSYDEAYFNKIVDKDGTEKIVPDYDAQVGFMKAQIAKEGKQGLLADIAFDKQFNSSGKDNIEAYKERARATTGREDDAKYLYELENSKGKYFESSEFAAAKKDKPSTTVSRTRNKSGDIVDLLTTPRQLNIAGTDYDQVYSLPTAVNIPSFTIKGAQEVVDGELTKPKTSVYKGRLTDVITENGKITKLKIEVPSDRVKTDSEGNQIYTLRGVEGTKEELLNISKDTGRGWDKGYISRNAEPLKETDKTKTIIAPASENKALTERFRIEGISKVGESPESKKVELTEGSLDEL